MLAIELNNNMIPQLRLEDTIDKSLQLMHDYKVSHLPVVSEEKYLGLLSEDDLLDSDNKKKNIRSLQSEFIDISIRDNEHFLHALTISNQYQTSVIPVVNEEKEIIGSITVQNLLQALGNFLGPLEMGGTIVLEMERSQFAISEISRIVESNEAMILHLNTTIQPETGMLTVTIQLNKKELHAIVASFERYNYNVLYYFGEEKFENKIHSNYRHLMNYLDI